MSNRDKLNRRPVLEAKLVGIPKEQILATTERSIRDWARDTNRPHMIDPMLARWRKIIEEVYAS